MKNAIVLCSGGLDSVVVAHYVKKRLEYEKILILFFDYGQRNLSGEIESAKKCAEDLEGEFIEIKIGLFDKTIGNLLNEEKAEKIGKEELKDSREESLKWYVPHRNLIFLSYAMSLAESLEFRGEGRYDIFVGFKNEGKEGFPDASAEFVEEINKLKEISSEKKFEIFAPFIKKDKEDIVSLGKELNVDLGKTWSCYASGSEKQCGMCLACALRREGFKWAGVLDSTDYQTL